MWNWAVFVCFSFPIEIIVIMYKLNNERKPSVGWLRPDGSTNNTSGLPLPVYPQWFNGGNSRPYLLRSKGAFNILCTPRNHFMMWNFTEPHFVLPFIRLRVDVFSVQILLTLCQVSFDQWKCWNQRNGPRRYYAKKLGCHLKQYQR